MDDECAIDVDLSTFEQLMIGIGSIISLIALIANLFVFIALLRHRRCFRCYFQYLMLMGFFDTIVCLMYIPVIAIDHLKDVTGSLMLARVWWCYSRVLLAVSHVAMSASSYLLIGATVERYAMIIKTEYLPTVQRSRTFITIVAISIALLAKAPIAVELELIHNENCSDTLAENAIGLADVCSTLWYGTVYRFWCRNICTVFAPFAMLAYLNLRIVAKLKKQFRIARQLSVFNRRPTKCKVQMRSATRMLVLIVVTYLLNNLINVVITAWEFIDFDTLIANHYHLYMMCTDIVSVLTVLSCALRLPIYLICNKELRHVLLAWRYRRQKCLTTSAVIDDDNTYYVATINDGCNDISVGSTEAGASIVSIDVAASTMC